MKQITLKTSSNYNPCKAFFGGFLLQFNTAYNKRNLSYNSQEKIQNGFSLVALCHIDSSGWCTDCCHLDFAGISFTSIPASLS